MSTKELRRVEVFSQVRSRALRLVDAAEMLSLSYRQTKRLWVALPARRGCGVAAPRCRSCLPPRQVARFSRTSPALDSGEVRRRRPGAVLRAHAGRRASGRRRSSAHRRRDFTALDAGRRIMEPPARKETRASPATSAQGAFWGTGAARRQLSCLVRAARPPRLSDEHG